MFINVVITRVILFCPAVPPSPPSAQSLVPRNATSFIPLLAKVLRPSNVPLFLTACVRDRERRKEESEERSLARECSFLSRPLALRFFHPFFLSFFLFVSFMRFPSEFFFHLSLFLTLSLPLALSTMLSLTRSPLSLTHFPPLPQRRRFSPPRFSFSRWFSCIPCSPFPLLSFVLLFSRGWLPFSIRVRAKVYLPLTLTTTTTTTAAAAVAAAFATTPFFPSSFFLSLSIAVFCSLRI